MQDTNEMRDRLTTEFVENYMEKLFFFCLKKTSSHVEAEDLTQDVALHIITALNKGIIPTSFSAWVWQIARNRYSVWAKEKHNRNESVTGYDIGDYELEEEHENILEKHIHKEQMALLRRELAFIKSDYRNIVVAYYIENKNLREIAESLSLSTNTVKSRLLRARQILKEGMDMAREFGKRSYDPANIFYDNICESPGELGQPWSLMDPKLNQNIYLSCYDNPMSAEELAIEMGVALPYMEDTVNHLTEQTLLIKKGGKYETNFPIISREALHRVHLYYEDILPRLTDLIAENTDCLMAQYNEAGLSYYGSYQSYEEAKWILLPNLFKGLYALCENSPKIKLGHTRRKDGGIWDILAYEICDFTPDPIGPNSITNGFNHYRIRYKGKQISTPVYLSKDDTYELLLMVKNKSPQKISSAEKLVECGYAAKIDGKYVPRVAVISGETDRVFAKFCKKNKHSAAFNEHSSRRRELHAKIMTLLCQINCRVREILYDDLPESIRTQSNVVDAVLESFCTAHHTFGYLAKYALASGWLKYDEDMSSSIGAFIYIP